MMVHLSTIDQIVVYGNVSAKEMQLIVEDGDDYFIAVLRETFA